MDKCPREQCQSIDIEKLTTLEIDGIKLETYWCNTCNHSFHVKTVRGEVRIMKHD